MELEFEEKFCYNNITTIFTDENFCDKTNYDDLKETNQQFYSSSEFDESTVFLCFLAGISLYYTAVLYLMWPMIKELNIHQQQIDAILSEFDEPTLATLTIEQLKKLYDERYNEN